MKIKLFFLSTNITKILFVIFLSFIGLTLNAQDDDIASEEYSEAFLEALNTPNCYTPKLNTSSVIHYSEGAALFLQFESDPEDVLLVDEDGNEIFIGLNENLSDNNYLLRGLPKAKAYTLYVNNTCNESEAIASITTSKLKSSSGIEVSDNLYAAIRTFQVDGADGELGTFCEHLADVEDVHFFEKVFFIQNFYEDKSDIENFSERKLLKCSPPDEEECLCRFTLNRSQVASPSIPSNGSISSSTLTTPNSPLGKGEYWSIRSNKGPSKYHQLWTQGRKDGSGTYQTTLGEQEENVSYQNAVLRYNYFCEGFGFNQVPENCACDIPVRFYYSYDTEVAAFGNLVSGGVGNKRAFAAAEDIGIAAYALENTDNLQIVDAINARAVGECDYTINPEFWQNISNVVFELAEIAAPFLIGGSSSINNPDLDDLAEDVSSLIGTPYLSENSCDLVASRIASMSGSTTVYLSPNQPINFYIFSRSDLNAGGKRSWHSWGRILSNFYLAGVILADQSAEDHCCIEKTASWIYAARNGSPQNEANVANELGAILNNWSPWPYPNNFGGSVILPTEYGTMTQNEGFCDSEDGGFSENEINMKAIFSDPSIVIETVNIYTTLGERIWSGHNISNDLILQQNWSELSINNLPYSGVYFIEKFSSDKRLTEKIFISNHK